MMMEETLKNETLGNKMSDEEIKFPRQDLCSSLEDDAS